MTTYEDVTDTPQAEAPKPPWLNVGDEVLVKTPRGQWKLGKVREIDLVEKSARVEFPDMPGGWYDTEYLTDQLTPNRATVVPWPECLDSDVELKAEAELSPLVAEFPGRCHRIGEGSLAVERLVDKLRGRRILLP